MAEVQEKTHTIAPEEEKHGLSEHREVSATPDKASSNHDAEASNDADDFKNTAWGLKDRIAALSLSGLYVGKLGSRASRHPTLYHRLLLHSTHLANHSSTPAGSQIPLYFVGGSLSFIAADIGGAAVSAWLPVAYALALAAVAPFSGYLQDLVGRRNITLLGGLVLMVGIIALATAKSFGAGVVGMGLAGAGAAIGELTALAGYVSRLLVVCLLADMF